MSTSTNATITEDGNLTTVTQELKDKMQKLIVDRMETIIDIAFIDHFKHSTTLKENQFKTLTEFIQPNSLGKKKMRPWLDMLIEPTFRNCKLSHQNCAAAAQDLLIACQKVYGENIFKAVMQNIDDRYPE